MNAPPSNIATIHEAFLSKQQADDLYQLLISNTDVRNKDALLLPDGTTTYTDTGKCMFVDEELTDFDNFLAVHGRRFLWPDWLLPLRNTLEKMLQREFNVCVAMYYPNGDIGVDYHTDYPAFGSTKTLPSISLGAPRTFSLKEKSEPNDVYNIEMRHGDLVVMREECQNLFEHALLVESKVTEPRINLTFRPFNWRRVKRTSPLRYPKQA